MRAHRWQARDRRAEHADAVRLSESGQRLRARSEQRRGIRCASREGVRQPGGTRCFRNSSRWPSAPRAAPGDVGMHAEEATGCGGQVARCTGNDADLYDRPLYANRFGIDRSPAAGRCHIARGCPFHPALAGDHPNSTRTRCRACLLPLASATCIWPRWAADGIIGRAHHHRAICIGVSLPSGTMPTMPRPTSSAHGLGLHTRRALARRTSRCADHACAEAVWWRCHRRIVADYLLAAGMSVEHIMGPDQVTPATLTPGVRIMRDRDALRIRRQRRGERQRTRSSARPFHRRQPREDEQRRARGGRRSKNHEESESLGRRKIRAGRRSRNGSPGGMFCGRFAELEHAVDQAATWWSVPPPARAAAARSGCRSPSTPMPRSMLDAEAVMKSSGMPSQAM